jgi:hypothetical protein
MSGGTIYKKQTISGAQQGTGDNSLIIGPKHAYQVPFSFGDNWEEINIGAFFSVVSGDSLNSGFDASDKISGGTTNDTFTWIGITKNAQTKTLPLDAANQGFLGYKADTIRFGDVIANQEYYHCYTLGSSSARMVSSYGESQLDNSSISYVNGLINTRGYTDGADGPQNSENFCSYFGIKYTVINKGQSNQTISVNMCKPSGWFAALHPLDDRNFYSNPSSVELRSLLDGDQVESYTSLQTFNQNGAAIDLPDSFFFYNGFDESANENVRPRIHAWAVKKIR